MSIDLGFAPCNIADMQVGIVDVPGHENFVKTMVAGAASMDGVIFVVAADDGVMPQTREHLEILTLLGIRHGLVALTKVDRVTPDQQEAAVQHLKEFLRTTFLANAAICPLSNITGAGFDFFLDELKTLVNSITPRRSDGLFRLPVERSFSAKGSGTVIAGIPVSGSIRVGDEVILLPQQQKGKIKALEVYKRKSDIAQAGQCAALNIPQLDHRQIQRGDTLTVADYFTPQLWYLCRLQLLTRPQSLLKNGQQVKFHVGTSEVTAAVYLMQDESLAAAREALVQIRLNHPLVAAPRDRFIIRSLSPVQTIGGGMVIESLPRRLKRNIPEIQQDLLDRAASVLDENTFVEYCLKTSESAAVAPLELAQRTKIPLPRTSEILSELVAQNKIVSLPGSVFFHLATASQRQQKLLTLIEQFHRESPSSPGIRYEDLQILSLLPRSVLDYLLNHLKETGQITERNHRLALPTHHESYPDEDRLQIEKVESLFRRQLFNPPSPDEVAAAAALPKDKVMALLKILIEQERLIRIDKDLFFHTDAVQQARQLLIDHIRKEGQLQSVDFKYLLNTTRKFAIPLLDYFDKINLTRRCGYTRLLKNPPSNSR